MRHGAAAPPPAFRSAPWSAAAAHPHTAVAEDNQLILERRDKLKALREHVAQEKLAVNNDDVAGRTELLGDFHVRMAELMGNQVLAELLRDLISRCALITLMYQSNQAAAHSHDEHADIVKALAARDEELAVRLMTEHLLHVEENLTFDRKLPINDLSLALS